MYINFYVKIYSFFFLRVEEGQGLADSLICSELLGQRATSPTFIYSEGGESSTIVADPLKSFRPLSSVGRLCSLSSIFPIVRVVASLRFPARSKRWDSWSIR